MIVLFFLLHFLFLHLINVLLSDINFFDLLINFESSVDQLEDILGEEVWVLDEISRMDQPSVIKVMDEVRSTLIGFILNYTNIYLNHSIKLLDSRMMRVDLKNVLFFVEINIRFHCSSGFDPLSIGSVVHHVSDNHSWVINESQRNLYVLYDGFKLFLGIVNQRLVSLR